MDFSRNEDIRTLRVHAWRRPPGIATFIGAGCSEVLMIPLWKQMLIGLNDEFKYYSSDEELEADIDKYSYAQVASKIKSKVQNETAYKDLLRKFITPQACHYTSLHLEIVLLSKLILTTNYDKSFEQALDAIGKFNPQPDCQYQVSTLGDFNHDGWGQDRHIFHVHGDIDSADVVLTEESYSEQYDNSHSGVSMLIGSIFSRYTTLFIGFSFDDYYFVKFLSKALEGIRKDANRYNKKLPEHYCIMSDSLLKKHLTVSELLSFTDNIDLLINEGMIKETSKGKSAERSFNITVTASDLVKNTSIEESIKKAFLSQIELMERNQDKVKVLSDIGISIIPFEGNNYLQIEFILRELNKKPSVQAAEFRPN
jgi:NAD-dependent SIR2 family protein deacetylase